LVLLVACVVLDGLRPPDAQLTGRLYIGMVHVYQSVGHPLPEGKVRCRFQPTCSNYSISAVRKFGFLRGVRLTAARVMRCRSNIPVGTSDPLP
jgi:hypothetical protein